MIAAFDPPAHSVAIDALIGTQTATTRVKEIIAQGVSNNWSEKALTEKLNTAIAEQVNKISNSNAALAEQTRKALITAARKWHYELTRTYDILNRNLANNAQLREQTYTVGIDNIFKALKGNAVAAFRPYLDDGRSPIVPIIDDYRRKVQIAMAALAAEPPKIIQTKNGRVYQMPLRNYAEMTVRYEAGLRDIERIRAAGVKLVWTTSHPNASPRCAPFQGRLWSLDSTSGVEDGNQYKPIEIALQGPLKDGNGIISGYNCRHRLTVYQKGSKAPAEYSEAEIKREYAKDKLQRRYENNIRQLKVAEKLCRASGDLEKARKLRQKWRSLTADYKLKSLDMGREYFSYRCVVDEVELI